MVKPTQIDISIAAGEFKNAETQYNYYKPLFEAAELNLIEKENVLINTMAYTNKPDILIGSTVYKIVGLRLIPYTVYGVTPSAPTSPIFSPPTPCECEDANPGDSASVSVTADHLSIPADGNSLTTITAFVLDSSGQPMDNIVVTFTTTSGTLASSNSITDVNGLALMSTLDVESATVMVMAESISSFGGVVINFV